MRLLSKVFLQNGKRFVSLVFMLGSLSWGSTHAQLPNLVDSQISQSTQESAHPAASKSKFFDVRYSADKCPDLESDYWEKNLCTSDVMENNLEVKTYCNQKQDKSSRLAKKDKLFSCKASALIKFLNELSKLNKDEKLSSLLSNVKFGAVVNLPDFPDGSGDLPDVIIAQIKQLSLPNGSSLLFSIGEVTDRCIDDLSDEIMLIDSHERTQRRLLMLSLNQSKHKIVMDRGCNQFWKNGRYTDILKSSDNSTTTYVLTPKYLYTFSDNRLFGIFDLMLNPIYIRDAGRVRVVDAVWANQILYPDAPYISSREEYMHRIDRLVKAVFNK